MCGKLFYWERAMTMPSPLYLYLLCCTWSYQSFGQWNTRKNDSSRVDTYFHTEAYLLRIRPPGTQEPCYKLVQLSCWREAMWRGCKITWRAATVRTTEAPTLQYIPRPRYVREAFLDLPAQTICFFSFQVS